MVLSIAIGSLLIQPPSKTASPQAVLEAVDAAVSKAQPFFSGQDYLGFNSGAPALVGGFVRQDDTLAWPLKYPTDHYVEFFVGAQRGSFPFNVRIEDSEGNAVSQSEKAATSHEINFQPTPKKEYLLVIKPEGASENRYSQVAAIISTVGSGLQYKPSQFSAIAKTLVKLSRPLMKGAGFVNSMNLFAVPLSSGASCGPEAREAGRTQTRNTMVLVSDGRSKTFTAALRTPDGKLAGSSKRVGLASALRITVDPNVNGHSGAPLHLKNTGRSASLFMGGIISK